jgi:hypothetical protein
MMDKTEKLNSVHWISIEERLPEDGQRVLTYCRACFCKVEIHTYYKNFHQDLGQWWIGFQSCEVAAGKVTHWAYLPDVPKEGD